MKSLLGYSNQEMQDTVEAWGRLIHPEDMSLLESVIDAGKTGRFPGEDIEFRMFHHDGSTRGFSVRGKVFRDETGYPLRIFGIVSEITERKNIEGELEKAVVKMGVSVRQLEQRNRDLTLLNELGSLLQTCTSSNEAYAVAADMIPKLFPEHSGSLYLFSQARDYLVSLVSWRNPLSKQTFPPNDCWALRRGRMHIVTPQYSRLLCQHIENPKNLILPYVCTTLNAQGEVMGLLHLQGDPGRDVEAWTKLVGTVADQLALAFSNIVLSETVREHATRDSLTGLYNRQYMNETLEREFHRAERRKDTVGVIMFDIDFFKQYNDTYGHLVGDTLLEILGDFLKSKTRGEDVVCRYGGDEFIIILPGANEEGTLYRAQQLQEGAKNLPTVFKGKSLARINLSMGVAIFPQHGFNQEDILRAADNALLDAKNEGRDRVVVAKIHTRKKGDYRASA
jgi:diguanylate cyclase (GGDEF)-like protein/PAS domain S-box-containing protein